MDKIYIGLSSSQHDSSIAVVNSVGKVIFAEANERSLKNKRAWNTVPDAIGSIERIVEKYGENKHFVAALTWSDKSLKYTPLVNRFLRLKIKYTNKFASDSEKKGLQYLNYGMQQSMYKAPRSSKDMLHNLSYRIFEKDKAQTLSKKTFDHHLCHAATACYTSNFDHALCLIVDGMGESGSVALFEYRNDAIHLLKKSGKLNFASLGLFYGSICRACGFDPIKGEEWKVMGLAAYGKKNEDLYQLLKPMLKVKNYCFHQSKDYAKRLTKLYKLRGTFIETIEAADLAFTGQLIFEELMIELIQAIHDKYGGKNLVLGGGCALNSSCNGKIIPKTAFENLHISMAPGDDGNALGAALLAWKSDHPDQKTMICHSPYLGSVISLESIERFVKYSAMQTKLCLSEDEMVDLVSDELIAGKLVGWIQGKAEFGSRALGNRSILADPRNKDCKDRINKLVKFREEFRPFAPSILHEKGADYFYEYSYTPYMEKALQFSDIASAPGVVHLDNTGRLQSVTEELNEIFYKLISKFHQKTGVPILLNTSFNVMGRPIVHDIEDAFGVFLGSGLDTLVIGNYIFRK